MSDDWCPGIREACRYWPDAPMLQHTFQALERDLEAQSDAAIDACKGLVECVCKLILDELEDPASPVRPSKPDANIIEWFAAARRVLGVSDVRDRGFANLVKHHNSLAESLRDLRNESGPVSHGRSGFIQTLSAYHRRSAALAADALVTFLHQAYLEADVDLRRTNEPYDRFVRFNALIDEFVSIESRTDDQGALILWAVLPSGDAVSLAAEPSRLLYQLDRDGYIEALNASM
jgi:Abortive infection C-terminus